MILKCVGIIFLIASLCLVVSAQDLEASVDDAGTTPDSIVWGLDRAIEKIELAMTFNNAGKERKRLEHAHERLLEVKKMIEEGKIEDAERAREKHAETLEISRQKIAKISSEDDSDLEDIALLEDNIEVQKTEVEDLEVSIKVSGTLNDNQKKLLQDFVDSLNGDVDKVNIVIRDKEDETLTKIERNTGKSRIEIIDELGELREKKIVRAEVFDGYSIIKVGHRFTTRTTEREALIREIIDKFAVTDSKVENLLKIENADDDETADKDRLKVRINIHEKENVSIVEVHLILRKRVNVTSKEELQSAVVEATRLTKEQIQNAIFVHNDEDKDNETEREIEIKSKTQDGVVYTLVKIEWDGRKKELVLHTADREEIVSKIASLLNVSLEEVNGAIKKFELENEDLDDQDDNNTDEEED